MDARSQHISPDIEAAVEANHGGPVMVDGQHGRYVVMNLDVFGSAQEATAAEVEASLAGIKRSLDQAAAGQTRDIDEVFAELKSRYAS